MYHGTFSCLYYSAIVYGASKMLKPTIAYHGWGGYILRSHELNK